MPWVYQYHMDCQSQRAKPNRQFLLAPCPFYCLLSHLILRLDNTPEKIIHINRINEIDIIDISRK